MIIYPGSVVQESEIAGREEDDVGNIFLYCESLQGQYRFKFKQVSTKPYEGYLTRQSPELSTYVLPSLLNTKKHIYLSLWS